MTAAAALDPQQPDAEQIAEVREVVVLDAATRLAALVEKLLDLSRLQAGEATAARRRVRARGGDHRGDRARRRRQRAGSNLARRRAAAARRRRGQLERAFANLIENALRYGAGKPVSVRARVVGDRVRVRIVDQGPGIRAGELERIFLPFYRSPGQAARPPGLGAWARDRQGLHRGQRRADLRRIAARAGDELRRRASAQRRRRPRRTPRSDGRRADPRLRRRPADPARAAAGPARCRLRGAHERDRGGGARSRRDSAARTPRSST